MSTWPIDWPAAGIADRDAAEPETVALAERYAASSMQQLTLNRVGGLPVTVMPCNRSCTSPIMRRDMFMPVPWISSSDLKTCNCSIGCACSPINSVELAQPVGEIIEVTVDGTVLDASEYRVEDGRYLIRNDGKRWPACAGKNFTVTYLNAHPVDSMGAYAGGIMAWEWLKALTPATGRNGNNCRLSSKVTSVNRQGITMELQPGLFPDGTTGIEEVDLYVRLWNPHGAKVLPKVYTLDAPRQRRVTLGAF